MTAVTVAGDAGAELAQVALSHLSIEVGHLYMEDLQRGEDRIAEVMRAASPWVAAARSACADRLGVAQVRVSTCFMIDDYFGNVGSPREIVPAILRAAGDAGVQIDYLAREAACAAADGLEPARLVLDRLVPDPPRGARGVRPDVFTSGWLCNGERSPGPDPAHAMRVVPAWRPPVENGHHRHSIFVDVQVWDDSDGKRTWSCPYLAAVWQLLRLGLLRHDGVPVASPRPWDEATLPDRWADLHPITRLRAEAKPFAAYSTMSVLESRFQPIEHAVRTILSQVDVGPAVTGQIRARAGAETVPVSLPPEIIDRIEYVFFGPRWR